MMKHALLAALAAAFLPACAGLRPASPEPTTVHFQNVHEKDVTVAVACGDLGAQVLGVVPAGGLGDFAIPEETTRCIWGLRFLLMPDGHPKGYVTELIRVRRGGELDFWIEKYPALSAWQAR